VHKAFPWTHVQLRQSWPTLVIADDHINMWSVQTFSGTVRVAGSFLDIIALVFFSKYGGHVLILLVGHYWQLLKTFACVLTVSNRSSGLIDCVISGDVSPMNYHFDIQVEPLEIAIPSTETAIVRSPWRVIYRWCNPKLSGSAPPSNSILLRTVARPWQTSIYVVS
jgi:hypothetical protein